MKKCYLVDAASVVRELDSDTITGLSKGEANRRLAEYGLNELIERGAKNPWLILWEQMTAVMVLILIFAAIVSLFLGEWDDAIVIMIIVILNAVLGFSQEYRAEKAIEALQKLSSPVALVLRNGKKVSISSTELVPGDIVFLENRNPINRISSQIEDIKIIIEF